MANPKRIASLLISWFERGHRAMPWRKTRDPYAIWVSEIMLQQTRVDTVIPYYERWMARFPTVEALACAPLEEVLELWSGLGYYSRARSLHRAAGEIVSQRGGELPHVAAELVTLSGIGPYTAGAIASIAFGEAVPAIDGNGERVLSRLFLLEDRKRAWEVARAMVPAEKPSAFNQGLMELGATLCKRNPECTKCPLQNECLANQRGLVADYPAAKARRQVPTIALSCLVISRKNGAQYLVVKRPECGLWAGLWEFPTMLPNAAQIAEVDRITTGATSDVAAAPALPKASRVSAVADVPPPSSGKPAGRPFAPTVASVDKPVAHFLASAGLELVDPEPALMFRFEHVLTHRNLVFSVFRAELAETEQLKPSARRAPRAETISGLHAKWLALDDILAAAISAATRRIAQAVRNCDYALPGETLPTSSKAASSRPSASSSSVSAMSMGGQMRKTLP